MIETSTIIGIILIVIALWGFSPWLGGYAFSIVKIGPVEIREIPSYDASRIGISAILLIAGIVVLTRIVPIPF